MGLFLQKTNIIRDYLEDYVDHRAFWPQSVWKKYAASGELGYFTKQDDPEVRKMSLHCLNELVTDALELVPDCLAYLSKLQCEEIFRFCAIPQVMAISTLEKCYANSNVFTGVVKIRKGTSCKLLLKTNTLDEVHDTFFVYARAVMKTANMNLAKGIVDPSYDRTIKACENIMDLTLAGHKRQTTARRLPLACAALPLLALGIISRYSKDTAKIPFVREGLMLFALGGYTLTPYLIGPNTNLRPASALESK